MVPINPSHASKKGQYFSADAIIAAFIFVMALSLLTAHWFSLRAQGGSQTGSLLDDASRISDLLLVPGNPGNWYSSTSTIYSAGFGLNGSQAGTLNQTALVNAQAAINPNPSRYLMSRQLMALPADYYIEFNNLSSLDPEAPAYPSQDFPYIAIGRRPSQAIERAQVYRGVLISVPDTREIPPWSTVVKRPDIYYYGIMTVTVWTNKSTI